jgi:hypothetical protein
MTKPLIDERIFGCEPLIYNLALLFEANNVRVRPSGKFRVRVWSMWPVCWPDCTGLCHHRAHAFFTILSNGS